MGVDIHESLVNAQHGVCNFRAQGTIYHSIGGFLPICIAIPTLLPSTIHI